MKTENTTYRYYDIIKDKVDLSKLEDKTRYDCLLKANGKASLIKGHNVFSMLELGYITHILLPLETAEEGKDAVDILISTLDIQRSVLKEILEKCQYKEPVQSNGQIDLIWLENRVNFALKADYLQESIVIKEGWDKEITKLLSDFITAFERAYNPKTASDAYTLYCQKIKDVFIPSPHQRVEPISSLPFNSEQAPVDRDIIQEAIDEGEKKLKLLADFTKEEIMELFNIAPVDERKVVTDEKIRGMVYLYEQTISRHQYSVRANAYEKGLRDMRELFIPAKTDEVVKCDYCGRTEICKGQYPEGCFLENKLSAPVSKMQEEKNYEITDNFWDKIVEESKRLFPYEESDNHNRKNKLASKRRNFLEGAEFVNSLLIISNTK